MKVADDTNVLVHVAVQGDPTQVRIAVKVLIASELIAVALRCLRKFVWVLVRVYGFQPSDPPCVMRALTACANVEVNGPAVKAGFSVPQAGGDFIDGVIAYNGNWLGGERFAYFDKQAIPLLTVKGQLARLL